MENKNFNFYIYAFAIFFLFALSDYSCSSGKKELIIQGTVQSVERGKDGYTATLTADDGSDFDAVFSQVKLGDDYRVFTVGERLRVAGDSTRINNKLTVTVNKINPNINPQ